MKNFKNIFKIFPLSRDFQFLTNFCNFVFFFFCFSNKITFDRSSELFYRRYLTRLHEHEKPQRKIGWEKREQSGIQKKKNVYKNVYAIKKSRIEPIVLCMLLFFSHLGVLSFRSELDVATLYRTGRLVGWTDSYSIKIIILEFLLYLDEICCFYFIFVCFSFRKYHFKFLECSFFFRCSETCIRGSCRVGNGQPVACGMNGMFLFFPLLIYCHSDDVF